MNSFVEILKGIFSKLAGFFTVFDISYFMSGVATSAVVMGYIYAVDESLLEKMRTIASSLDGNVLFYIFICVAIYVLGLISFALGKWLRITIYREDDKSNNVFIERILKNADLHQSPFLKSFVAEEDYKGAYSFLWTVLRQNAMKDDVSKENYSFIYKKWVAQAIYEGMFATSMFGLVLVIIAANQIEEVNMNWKFWLLYIVALGVVFFLCREATRIAQTQVSEIVNTFAAKDAAGKSVEFEKYLK